MDENNVDKVEHKAITEKKAWSTPKLQVLNAKGAESGAAGATYEATFYHT